MVCYTPWNQFYEMNWVSVPEGLQGWKGSPLTSLLTKEERAILVVCSVCVCACQLLDYPINKEN